MTDKRWEDLTTAEKAERLNLQLDSVVNQLNIVTGNIHRRLNNLEADVDKLSKD